jgi:membrane protein implicated in regulation of membrane protease activity
MLVLDYSKTYMPRLVVTYIRIWALCFGLLVSMLLITLALEPLWRAFNSFVFLVSWETWQERNRRTFDNAFRMPHQLIEVIHDKAESWVATGFRGVCPMLASLFSAWVVSSAFCCKIVFSLVTSFQLHHISRCLVSVFPALISRYLDMWGAG